MGPPKRRSKATWGRYPNLNKGDVLFYLTQNFKNWNCLLNQNGVYDNLKPLKREGCQAVFTLKYTLDHHIKVVHDKPKPFKCSDFDSLKKVDIHTNSQDSSINKLHFLAKFVNFVFIKKSICSSRLSAKHEVKKFGCNFCQKRFVHAMQNIT